MLWHLIEAVERVDQLLCWNPIWKLGRDTILDSVFGPAEHFEYTSKTTPVEPQ